ncbi:MAG: tetratricopeptide repeat protein [Pseudomonadales bacterium]|nr:tetratricopeptide repeat protein [Pseudomonadales bacterium]
MKIRIFTAYLILVAGLCTHQAQANDIVSFQHEILQHRSEGDYKQAIEKQITLLNLVQKLDSPDSGELSIHYYNMGTLYFENDEYRKATKPFKKSIKTMQEIQGPFSEAIVDSLAKLGICYYKIGNLDAALDNFQQAQHIVHRLDGVKSIEQDALLNWMSIVQIRRQDLKAANTLQRFRYENYRFNYGEDSAETVPSLLVLAKWFQTSAQYTDSAKAYKRAINIIERNHLPTATLQQSLSGLANIHYLKGQCCADDYMAQRAKLVSNDADFDNTEKSQAYIDAADMSLMHRGEQQPALLYKEAWHYGGDINSSTYGKPSILGISRIDRMIKAYRPEKNNVTTIYTQNSEETQNRTNVQIVGAPLQLCAAEIKDLAKNHDYSKYVVDMNFAVTAEGRATNIKVVDTNAPSSINQLMRRIVQLYRFRPKLADGVPVEEQMQLRQTFALQDNQVEQQFEVGSIAAIHGCHLLAAN